MSLNTSQKNSEGCLFYGNDSSYVISLLTKYAPLVKSRALSFLRYGCELEDLIQEGNIGLLSAATKYKSELSAFTTFAKKCIDSSIIDYLRKNHKISSIPNELLVDLNEIDVADNSQSPEYSVSVKEEYRNLLEKASSVLSKFEYSVFSDMISGFSLKEIALRNNCDAKVIHNAVQRIRAKLK